MKQLFQLITGFLLGWAEAALGARAGFGEQLMVPNYRTNSSYTSLSATRYIIVMQTAAQRANMATAATSSTILGVMQNNPDIDEAMSIACAGLSKVVAGGALTAGRMITTNGSGRAAHVQSGEIAIGRVLEAAGADGDVVMAMLFHPVRWSGAA